MQNFPDPECVYGYMTICDECLEKGTSIPNHVDTSEPIKEHWPMLECELCKSPVPASFSYH